jgi:transcriptional regulator with XRE-family HTH domain
MTFAERFGRNLAVARGRTGLSQEDLGLLAGLHRTAVGQLERGERVARSDTLVKLACALDASPLDLLVGLSWQPADLVVGAMDVAAIDGEPVGVEGGER